MTNRTIPEGWSYDEGDPSVGIFGHQWVHEACELEDDDPEVRESQWGSRLYSGEAGSRTALVTLSLTCMVCGEQALAQRLEWDPDE